MGLALTFALINSAHATLVNWTADLSFLNSRSNTNTLTGTFTYDTVTDTASNVNMVMNNGTGNQIITTAVSNVIDTDYSIQVNGTQLRATGINRTFVFNFGSSIDTDAGGVLNLISANNDINSLINPRNFSGGLTGVPQVSAVPVPAAAWLFATGLPVVGAFARRRKQQA